MQEFGGQRQAEAQHVQHQLPGQRQAGGHVVAAIQVRIVGEALPAHRGAWLFHVGAHHQEQLAVEFVAQRGEAFGVFEGGAGIVDRTGSDYHQQARVVAVEDGADGVAAGGDLAGQPSGNGWRALSSSGLGRRSRAVRAVALGRATAWTFGERVVSADTDEFMVWLPGLAAGVPRASCPIEVFGNVVGWRAAGGRR